MILHYQRPRQPSARVCRSSFYNVASVIVHKVYPLLSSAFPCIWQSESRWYTTQPCFTHSCTRPCQMIFLQAIFGGYCTPAAFRCRIHCEEINHRTVFLRAAFSPSTEPAPWEQALLCGVRIETRLRESDSKDVYC